MEINIKVDEKLEKKDEKVKVTIDNYDDYKKIMTFFNGVRASKKNSILTIEDIAKYKDIYYGKEVKGYECENSDGVDKWLLFLVNNKAYIITSNYIHKDYIPNIDKMSFINDYNFSFRGIIEYYKELYGYEVSTGLFHDDKNVKLKDVEYSTKYMLDKNVWRKYLGRHSEYVIGGPTKEMFEESYNDLFTLKHERSKRYPYHPCIKINDGKANGMWLSSYINTSSLSVKNIPVNNSHYIGLRPRITFIDIIGMETISNEGFVAYESCTDIYLGIRPLVCLKSDVKFIIEENGTLRLI